MSVDTPAVPPAEAPRKKRSCFLWGCLISLGLILIVFCCLATLVALPFVTDLDPLNLEDRLDDFGPWQEILDDPSGFPGLDDFMDEGLDPLLDDLPGIDVPTPGALAPTRPAVAAANIPLETYTGSDFPATFDYPAGWEISVEDYAVTFFDPDSYTYLFVGEDLIDPGKTAREVAEEVQQNLMEDAQSGSFRVIESAPYEVPTGDDAYLSAYDWVDSQGAPVWAFSLETVRGESNVFFFISGDDPDQAIIYAELIEIIAASFSR